MKLTLTLDSTDSKALDLLNYIRTLDFVKVEEPSSLTVQQMEAIDNGIASLDAGKGITHDDAIAAARNRFPQLFN